MPPKSAKWRYYSLSRKKQLKILQRLYTRLDFFQPTLLVRWYVFAPLADAEETTCQLDVAGKCSVKTTVKVPVKGILDLWKALWRKRCLLVDVIVRFKQTIQNIILTLFKASWRRKKWFLVDGLVKGRLPIPNIYLTFLKITWRRKRDDSWWME